MNKIEFEKKVIDVKKDIEEGQNVLRNHNRYNIKHAEEWVDKCQKNVDYSTFILANKSKNNLTGNLKFKDLNFQVQLNVLDCIISSIKQYLAKLVKDELEDK